MKNILSVLLLLSCFYGFTQPAYHKQWGVKTTSTIALNLDGRTFINEEARSFFGGLSGSINSILVADLPNAQHQLWASIGNDSNTSIHNIDYDEQGNVYVLGSTSAFEGFATAGVYKSDFDWDL